MVRPAGTSEGILQGRGGRLRHTSSLAFFFSFICAFVLGDVDVGVT